MARILLIEPDRLLAKNITAAFKRAGHQTDWCVDAQAAINTADAATPDLVILDLLLSFHGGIEFLYELRSYPEWVELPVIIFSSLPSEEVNFASSAFVQLGVNYFLPKISTGLAQLVTAANQLLQPVSG